MHHQTTKWLNVNSHRWNLWLKRWKPQKQSQLA